MGLQAASTDRDVNIDGPITLPQKAVTTFCWILTVLSAGGVVLGIFKWIESAYSTAELQLRSGSIVIPKGFIRKTIVEVPFSEITSVSEAERLGQRECYFHTASSKYCISQPLMPTKHDYDEAKAFLMQHIAPDPHRREDSS
jgi:hypothetical protein